MAGRHRAPKEGFPSEDDRQNSDDGGTAARRTEPVRGAAARPAGARPVGARGTAEYRPVAQDRGNPVMRGALVAGAVLLALVLVIVIVQWIRGGFGSGANCSDPRTVEVAADPGIVAQVTSAGDRIGTRDCVRLAVSQASNADMTTRLGTRDGAPDVWVADSSMHVGQNAGRALVSPEIVVPSVASTPVVLAGRPGEVPDIGSWQQVLTLPGLRLGDPLVSAAADAPIMAALGEAQSNGRPPESLLPALAGLAQRGASTPTSPSESVLLEAVAAEGGLAVATEAAAVRHLQAAGANPLLLKAPLAGSVNLDFPVVVTAQDEARRSDARTAARLLGDEMTGAAGVAALNQAGLRGADRAALPGAGVGPVAEIRPSDPALLGAVLGQWQVLATPSNTTVAIDLSGSMNVAVGNSTRIGVTVDAAREGLGMFPASAQMGLWAFSTDRGPRGEAYEQLVPRRRLDAAAAPGRTQRQELAAALNGLAGRIRGGTGLYETVLAAWRDVQANHDASSVNSVIVLTDGRNEASNSITLQRLLDTLRAEADPARPVIVVGVGISEDADEDALRQIAETTGGSWAVARTAAEIPQVFRQAMAARVR